LKLQELILRTERRLRTARLHYGHGTDNPHDEAAFLVLRGLGLPFDADLGQAADPSRVEPLVQKRIKERTPAAYLLNEAWLSGVPFYVDRRVIIPRSHIAGLLEARLEPWQPRPLRRVLDLCTGSGCLAILAARAFPAARVDALDLSPGALAVARKNVARYRLGRRVHLRRSDLFATLGAARYDLILANPPYVSAPAMATLPEPMASPAFSIKQRNAKASNSRSPSISHGSAGAANSTPTRAGKRAQSIARRTHSVTLTRLASLVCIALTEATQASIRSSVRWTSASILAKNSFTLGSRSGATSAANLRLTK